MLRTLTLLLALALAVWRSGDASAQSGGGYNLSWNTIDGGGVTFATGGGYTMGGTVGQPDAGSMSGGNYTLGGGFWHGGSIVTAVEPEVPLARTPREFKLHPSSPNPFNPRTQIAFDLAEPGTAKLDIYTVRGAHVRTLVSEALEAGSYHSTWDGTDEAGAAVASGTYIVRLQAGAHLQRQKIVLLK